MLSFKELKCRVLFHAYGAASAFRLRLGRAAWRADAAARGQDASTEDVSLMLAQDALDEAIRLFAASEFPSAARVLQMLDRMETVCPGLAESVLQPEADKLREMLKEMVKEG